MIYSLNVKRKALKGKIKKSKGEREKEGRKKRKKQKLPGWLHQPLGAGVPPRRWELLEGGGGREGATDRRPSWGPGGCDAGVGGGWHQGRASSPSHPRLLLSAPGGVSVRRAAEGELVRGGGTKAGTRLTDWLGDGSNYTICCVWIRLAPTPVPLLPALEVATFRIPLLRAPQLKGTTRRAGHLDVIFFFLVFPFPGLSVTSWFYFSCSFFYFALFPPFFN